MRADLITYGASSRCRASFVVANPGMPLSAAANRLVAEALRMAEHPAIIFRSGPTGRRAAWPAARTYGRSSLAQ
jgi:hypothetical protein